MDAKDELVAAQRRVEDARVSVHAAQLDYISAQDRLRDAHTAAREALARYNREL